MNLLIDIRKMNALFTLLNKLVLAKYYTFHNHVTNVLQLDYRTFASRQKFQERQDRPI